MKKPIKYPTIEDIQREKKHEKLIKSWEPTARERKNLLVKELRYLINRMSVKELEELLKLTTTIKANQ